MGSWRPASPLRGGGLQPSSTRDRRALCATAACSIAARREGSVGERHTGGPAELRGTAGRHAATSSSTELSSRHLLFRLFSTFCLLNFTLFIYFPFFSFIFSVWKKFFTNFFLYFFCKSFPFKFFSIFLFCKSFSFNFFLSPKFFLKNFLCLQNFFLWFFFLTFSPFKFFLWILFLIFLIKKRQKFTQKEKKYNGREIDHREPLPTVNRKLARPDHISYRIASDTH